MLGFLILTGDDQSGRQMRDTNSGVGCVDTLAAWTGRTENINAVLVRIKVYLHIFSLGNHRNSDGRGVDSALRFCYRHPLDPVDA